MAAKHRRPPPPPETCPVCGEEVPRNARACPECGADHRTGWNEEESLYDGIDLPDETFDYDEFLEREFGKPERPRGMKLVWWIAGIVLLAAVFYAFVIAGR